MRVLRALCWLLLCLPAWSQEIGPIHETGQQRSRVNIVVLGDGYTAAEAAKFRADATNTFNALRLGFEERDRPYLNGYFVRRESNESGCDEPANGIVRDTYYGCGFDTTIKQLLGPSYWGLVNGKVDASLAAPVNALVVMVVNTATYGGSGGGILCASLHSSSAEILRHEMGHTFARLSDEYCNAYPGWRQFETRNSSTNRLRPPWHHLTTNWIAGSQYNCTVWGRGFAACKMKDLGKPFCEICREAIHDAVMEWVGLEPEEDRPAPREFLIRSAEQSR